MATTGLNQTPQYFGGMQPAREQQIPNQFPYGNNNLIMNTPYDNYMGRTLFQQGMYNQNQYLKCRPVSSKDEARAFQIDLDGSLWVFTDVANEKIYTKQINADGTASFVTYIKAPDEEKESSPQYVTKEQFNRVIQALMAASQEDKSHGLNSKELMNF